MGCGLGQRLLGRLLVLDSLGHRIVGQRQKLQNVSWPKQLRRTFQWTEFCQISSPRYTQVKCLWRRPGRIPDSGRRSSTSNLLRQQEGPRRRCKWTWRKATRTVRIRSSEESQLSSSVNAIKQTPALRRESQPRACELAVWRAFRLPRSAPSLAARPPACSSPRSARVS